MLIQVPSPVGSIIGGSIIGDSIIGDSIIGAILPPFAAFGKAHPLRQGTPGCCRLPADHIIVV